jgi:signal transduction histidine kinase
MHRGVALSSEKENEMPETMLNLLIAEDDEGDRKQLRQVLKQTGLPCICTETSSIDDALDACEKCSFDCAIVDSLLPGQDGLSGITALHERLPYMAIIVVSGQGDVMVAAEAIKRGASDYIPKAHIATESIRRSVENAVAKLSLRRTVARQQSELEGFTRVLVHDLTSPIQSALVYATLAGENIRDGKSEKAASNCGKLVSVIKGMSLLIDTLHGYTTAEARVAFERLEMRDVMTNTLSNLEHLISARGANVTYAELPAVSGTPQLTQLLQNLIGNAIKYCEAPIPSVHVSAKPHGEQQNMWRFSVADNGIGIPEKDHQQIFEPFHRLRKEYDGTGLGLATCKKIVERHGGVISCESKEGQGTTFFFTLPAA